MPNPDVVRLRHMREAAASALEMAAGRTRTELDENLMLRMALTRCLEILGEAAASSPAPLKSFHRAKNVNITGSLGPGAVGPLRE